MTPDPVHLELLASGRHHLQSGDFVSAVSTFNSFLRNISGKPSLKFALLEGHLCKGVGLLALHEFNESIEHFNKALALASEFSYSRRVEILWRRGQAYQQSGLATRAIADFTTALSENPRFFDAFLSRGILLFSLCRYIQAYSDFSFAIQIDPRNSDPYIWRAQCLLFLKAPPSYVNYTSALLDCSIALSISPDDPRCLIIKARALLGLHQYPLAKEAYFAAVSVNASISDDELLRAINRGVKRGPENELTHDDKRIKAGPHIFQNAAF